VTHELLGPLRYAVLILDHEAVQEFIAPPYLEGVCLIINEADHLAQDRASEVAQQSTKTERILSLIDGTLHQSVLAPDYLDCEQRLVVLMTCNTTERLEPAVLRQGRVDLVQEFTHRFARAAIGSHLFSSPDRSGEQLRPIFDLGQAGVG
jgi:hypothetical protein